ncbi:hypothetical protein E4U50_007783 [Claviceps purpurea]|nr:hypothetical protein E4U37_006264 [Claviceps purpurea]KAG6215273.1 hypothetical protein E4U50_007783 [Claviceps purpurea]
MSFLSPLSAFARPDSSQLPCLLYDNFRPLLAMTVHFQLHCLLSTQQTLLTLLVNNDYFSLNFRGGYFELRRLWSGATTC